STSQVNCESKFIKRNVRARLFVTYIHNNVEQKARHTRHRYRTTVAAPGEHGYNAAANYF
ncbi:MAG TPA: hypothetical protein VNT33_00950, partial [Telluria sp.]|nr:hypothetical protein [Telluria sp.]